VKDHTSVEFVGVVLTWNASLGALFGSRDAISFHDPCGRQTPLATIKVTKLAKALTSACSSYSNDAHLGCAPFRFSLRDI